MKLVCEDEDVLFYWSILSIDLDIEHNAALLLKEIVKLWLTIRGFSVAGQWLEIYKNRALTTKKSLRKTLKRDQTSKSNSLTKKTTPLRKTKRTITKPSIIRKLLED